MEKNENFWSRSFNYGCSFWSFFNFCRCSRTGCPEKEYPCCDEVCDVSTSQCRKLSHQANNINKEMEQNLLKEFMSVETKQPAAKVDGKALEPLLNMESFKNFQNNRTENCQRCSIDLSSQSSSFTSSCLSNGALDSSGISLGIPDLQEIPCSSKIHETGEQRESVQMVDKMGEQFLRLASLQQEQLKGLCQKTEFYLIQFSGDLSIEAEGLIRAAIGKANLLLGKKFKQFRELCTMNLTFNDEVRKTTNEDLSGFWDLIILQVEDVKKMFDEIESLKENQWKKVETPERLAFDGRQVCAISPNHKSSKLLGNRNTVGKSSSTAVDRCREDARKRLLAAKSEGRQNKAAEDFKIIFFL